MDIQILEKLGLTPKAVEVYLASLQLGPNTIQKIAKKANLPRSSTYLLIDELKSKGLISETEFGKKSIFTPSPPEKLMQIAKGKVQDSEKNIELINSFLPQLNAMYRNQPNKPSVRFYEGFEGVKTILEETLKAKEIFVLCSGYNKPIEKKLSEYLEEYFAKVIKAKITTHEIIGGGIESKDYQKQFSSANNQIQIVEYQKGLEHIDKLIFENKVAIISYVYLNGVIIENAQIAEYEKVIFWELWKNLK
jgi:sugar-specific transcriptional regulator TrmB